MHQRSAPAGADPRLRFVDLSMTLERHWRFPFTAAAREVAMPGFTFHSTDLVVGAHGFTHVDAPWHVDPEGTRLTDVDTDRLWGDAVVVDVTHVGGDAGLDRATLEPACADVRAGDIVLLRTDHGSRHPTSDRQYWTAAPWVTRSGAEYLRELDVASVGFDFPQDRGIRADYSDDWSPHPSDPVEDWACHLVLLANGIPQIEYLSGLAELTRRRTTFFAVPLRIADSDGSPVRAFALEPVDQEATA